jgi:hypothetical protein
MVMKIAVSAVVWTRRGTGEVETALDMWRPFRSLIRDPRCEPINVTYPSGEGVRNPICRASCRFLTDAAAEELTFQGRRFGTSASERNICWAGCGIVESNKYLAGLGAALSPTPFGAGPLHFADAQRLTRRLLSGELILSFVPNPEQRDWRTITRRQSATGAGSSAARKSTGSVVGGNQDQAVQRRQ